MNKLKYIAFLFSVFIGTTLFFSCKKTFDKPPVNTIDLSGTITISQIRALYTGQNLQFTKDLSLYATVIMSDNYKTVYLRDHTGTISFRQITAHGIYQGDSLRVNLNGSWLDLSSTAGSVQIDSMDVGAKVIKLDYGKTPAPVPVSVYQLMHSITASGGMVNSVYDAQLVQLNDVQFSPADTGKPYLPPNSPIYVNHTLTDCGGLNSIVVSTYSNTPEFMQKNIPGKSGSLIAVASFYGGTLQLTLRSHTEIYLTQPRCGADTLTQDFTNCGTSANFNTALPGWYNINQLGYAFWIGTSANNLNFPSASSYLSSTSRNIMWLITPAIQNSPTKNLSFKSANKFWSANQLSVLLSTDFNGTNIGGVNFPTPNPAHWIDITAAFTTIATSGAPAFIFSDASPAPVQLSSFLPANYTGTFYIGFRYNGNQVDSTSTYAIDNVIIKN